MPQLTVPLGAIVPAFSPTGAPWLWVQSQGDFDLFKTDTGDRVVSAVAWTKRKLVSTKLTTTGQNALIAELGTYFTAGHLNTVTPAFASLPFWISDDGGIAGVATWGNSGGMVVDTASVGTVITALAAALANVA